MYFKIEENGLIAIGEKDFWEQEQTAAVFFYKELERSQRLSQICSFSDERENIKMCSMEQHADCIYITVSIPPKKNKQERENFSIYITREKIVFLVHEESSLSEIIEGLTEQKREQEYSREQFIYEVLCGIISKDFVYMEKLEKALSVMEEEVFCGGNKNFNSSMLEIKKRIFRFYRYYNQLVELANDLSEDTDGILKGEKNYFFVRYKEKAERLAAETQVLREYVMQIQEVYQSEIGIRQNNIMKMLTAVTAVFLPLTLIAGWYGMNFQSMPELSWKYGYPLVGGVSLAIFVITIWIFKRKGFW